MGPARKTHCKRGHDQSQYRVLSKDGKRAMGCKACQNKAWYEENREYAKQKRRDYYAAKPKEHWERNLMNKYGVTAEEYHKMLDEQGGLCAICERPEPNNRKLLSVDHDHHTGKVRALLCTRCNLTVGALDDSPDLATAIFEYLKFHKKPKLKVVSPSVKD